MSYTRKNPYSQILEPQINLDPDNFNALIATHGIRIRIDKTSVCPAWKANVKENRHNLTCTLCENGFVHYASIECYGFFQQNALQKMYMARGEFAQGRAFLTIPCADESGNQIIVGLYDRITLLDQKERFYELKNKSSSDIDILRYKALSVEFITTEARGVSNPFIYGTDFELDINSNIHWKTGGAKPSYNVTTGVGESFTVSYTFQPVYRIVQMIHEGRYSQKATTVKTMTNFPQMVLIQKDYYVDKRDPLGQFIKETPTDQIDPDDPNEKPNGAW